MPIVVILANHRAAAAERLVDRITDQLRARFGPHDAVVHVDDVRRLAPALAQNPDIVLAPLAYEGDGGFRAAVTAVRALAPELPIVACCDVSVNPEALLVAADARVDHFAVPAVDDIALVVQDVLAARVDDRLPRAQRRTGADPFDELVAALPPLAARLILAAAADEPPASVGQLAAGVGLAERTLTRRCARYQWPTPTMILRFGKLLRGMRVALATGSVEQGALAADCPGEPARAATYFRARLAAATSGALQSPLTDGLVPLCRTIAERFGITDHGQRARRRPPRSRRTRRSALPPEGTGLQEGGDDRAECADLP